MSIDGLFSKELNLAIERKTLVYLCNQMKAESVFAAHSYAIKHVSFSTVKQPKALFKGK